MRAKLTDALQRNFGKTSGPDMSEAIATQAQGGEGAARVGPAPLNEFRLGKESWSREIRVIRPGSPENTAGRLLP